MIYLHKLLPALLSPLMILFFILIFSIYIKNKWPPVFAIIVLLIISNPIIGNLATAYLEKDYPPVILTEIPKVDAIVVLSGMVNTIQGPNNTLKYEFNGAVDRIDAGVKLMKLHKAKILILTGGYLPWSLGMPEGEFLKEVAVSWGVDPSAIHLTKKVQNTDQEASAVSEIILKGQKIALITSAFHMPRAITVFASKNLQVIPVPVDHRSSAQKFQIMELLPDPGAVENITLFIKELIGRTYYSLKN